MKKTYRKHSPAFKTKVVLEALKERETLSELAQRCGLHPTQIAAWKKEFLEGAEQVFSDGPVVDAKAHEQEKAQLHQQIGELTVTVNWLKKSAVMPWDVRRTLVDRELAAKPADKGGLSIIKQCAVLEIHRSGLYYTPRPVIDQDLQLIRLMDLLHLEDPTKATDVTALAFTKIDGTAKGGVAIGISDQFSIPIKYLGVGEGIDHLQVFEKKAFVEALFKG